MSKKVLFSPIGGTDPISNMRDGSLLHIARKYKPNIIYLFYSKEICEAEERDNRYIKCLDWLGEIIDHRYKYIQIKEKDLSEVHDYDYFYNRFKEIIREISSNLEEGDELILNVSSGTPAMKSALHVIATILEYPFIVVQVATPEKAMNPRGEDHNKFDAEEQWECNFDNSENDYEDRCSEIKSENLILILKTDMIRKFVNSYDYKAARLIADEIKEEIPNDAYNLICAAEARLQMDKPTIEKRLKNTPFEKEIIPVESGNVRNIVEFMLILGIKIEKGELADFIRGITPVTADLFELILEKRCAIKVNDFCTIGNDGIRRWNKDKIRANQNICEILDENYQDGFKGTNVYSDHILALIRGLSTDNGLKKKVDEIRKVEALVRNIAAHDIASVTDEWIKGRTSTINKGMTAAGILKSLKELYKYAGLSGGDRIWKSYQNMNDIICTLLDGMKRDS